MLLRLAPVLVSSLVLPQCLPRLFRSLTLYPEYDHWVDSTIVPWLCEEAAAYSVER